MSCFNLVRVHVCFQASSALYAVVCPLGGLLHHRQNKDCSHRECHLLRHLPVYIRLPAHLRSSTSSVESVLVRAPKQSRSAHTGLASLWFMTEPELIFWPGTSCRRSASQRPTRGVCSCWCCWWATAWWKSHALTGKRLNKDTCSSRLTSKQLSWWRRKQTQRRTWRTSWRWAVHAY